VTAGAGTTGTGLRALAVGLIATANVIGGATYLAQKLALAGLPAATVILLRTLIALACMWAWVAPSGGLRWRFERRELVRLALLGVVACGLPQLLGILGLRWSTAGNGSILILLEPAAMLVFSWMLLRETIRPLQILGVLVGLAGGAGIVLSEAPLGDLLLDDYRLGNLLLALHGVLWGLYTPLMLPLARRHRAIDITFAGLAFSLLLLVPASLAEADRWQAGPELGPALLWTLGLGVIASFAATVMWTRSLAHLSAGTVAPFVFHRAGRGAGAVAGAQPTSARRGLDRAATGRPTRRSRRWRPRAGRAPGPRRGAGPRRPRRPAAAAHRRAR
jgi:drug/metabolite transporter (DMT)-like permease